MNISDTIKEQEILEKLAELEHEQWVEWSKAVADSEEISKDRYERWEKLWIPYKDLSENAKDQDRVYARKSLFLLKSSIHKTCLRIGCPCHDGHSECETAKKVEQNKEICTLCKNPFEPHHHKHTTRGGVFHTNCYGRNQESSPHTSRQEKWELEDLAIEYFGSDVFTESEKDFISKALLYQKEEYTRIMNSGRKLYQVGKKDMGEEIKKKLQTHCLDYCMHQNGREDCKNCGLSQELLDKIIKF